MSESMKSFIKGMGQAIDLGGTMAPRRPRVSPEVAARIAMARAFEEVGHGLRDAMSQERSSRALPAKKSE